MRLASIAKALFVSATLFACANTASIPDEDAGGAGGGPGNAVVDAGPMCVDHCATNSDCQDSCPAISGDVNCCDMSTGRCYLSAAKSCPVPVVDSGPMVTPVY